MRIIFIIFVTFCLVKLQGADDVNLNFAPATLDIDKITASTAFVLQNDTDKYKDYYKELAERDKSSYLLTSTGTLLGLMVIGVGLLYIMPSNFTKWNKQGLSNDVQHAAGNWSENVKNGPVWDNDNWFLNYVTHPYWGAVYYMQARNAGYDEFDSFLFSAFASTVLWEYGVEAFAEVPSIQDIIVTPVVGSLIGEGFYKISNNIKKNNEKVYGSKILGYTFLTLMDPMYLVINKTSLHKLTLKHPNQMQTSSSTWGVSAHSLVLQINIPVN